MKSAEEFSAFMKEVTKSVHEIADKHETNNFSYLMVCHLGLALATLMTQPAIFKEMEPQIKQLTELVMLFKYMAELQDPS